ncbi:MAG: glycosyltransferase [Patescibacteria group bacterium]
MNSPTISIVTCSYNTDLNILRKSLLSLKRQKYPQAKLQHIVMDGGSTNGSSNLFKLFRSTVVVRPDLLTKPQVRMSLGIAQATGELVLLLEPDNILPNSNWLQQMIKPFQDNERVVGAFSIYNSYDKTMPLLTKYCALIGANDPTLYYLNKLEKLPRFKKYYDKGEILCETKDYYLVKFDHENLPTLGDNGHIVRRSLIQKVNRNPEKFIHTDVFVELLEQGYDTYGVVKNSIIHYTGLNILHLFERRTDIKEKFYNARRRERKYLVFNPGWPKDWVNLFRFVIFSLTFVQPLMVSLRGLLVVPERAWFLHPVVCFIAVLSYTQSELGLRLAQVKSKLKKLFL